MEPIKPVEANSKNTQGQGSVLAEVLRESYWKQQAQKETSTVEASEKSLDSAQKRHDDSTVENRLQMRHTYAEFEINQDTREVTVRIIDSDSGKLVRTIPPEKLAEEIVKGNFRPNQLRRRAILV